jgi:hypothetical protein
MRTEEDITMDILKGYEISDLNTHYSLIKSRVTRYKNKLKKQTSPSGQRQYHNWLREAEATKANIKDLIIYLYNQHCAVNRIPEGRPTLNEILKKVDLKLTVIRKT